MADRPTFDYNGNPVRAAGILVYTFRGHQTVTFVPKYQGAI